MFSRSNFSCLCLSLLLLSIGASSSMGQSPKTGTPFQLPLTDETTVQTVLLPIDGTTLYLVYATRTGNLGLWTMTKGTTIDPVPPDPPVPPIDEILSIAVIEDPLDSSIEEVNTLADPGWRGYANANHNFIGIIPNDVIDFRTKKPPAFLFPFLVLAKGKDLPYLVILRSDGTVYWQGHLPKTPAEIIELIRKSKGFGNGTPNYQKRRLVPVASGSQQACEVRSPANVLRLFQTSDYSRQGNDDRALAGISSDHTQDVLAGLDPRYVWFLASRHAERNSSCSRSERDQPMLGSWICPSGRTDTTVGESKTSPSFAGFGGLSDRGNTRSRWVAGGCVRTNGQGRSLSPICMAGGGLIAEESCEGLGGTGPRSCSPEMGLGVQLGATNYVCHPSNPSCDSDTLVESSCLLHGSDVGRQRRPGHLVRQFVGRIIRRGRRRHHGRGIRDHDTGVVCGDKSDVLPVSPSGKIKVFFSPQGGCTEAIVSTIDASTASIRGQIYYFTSTPIAAALRRAHDRGVNVQIILDKSQKTALYSVADYLHNSGIPVWIDSAHATAHNKVLVVDSADVITGSFNWTKSAEERNAENLLIISDKEIAKLYGDNWKSHRAHSEPYKGHNVTIKPPDL